MDEFLQDSRVKALFAQWTAQRTLLSQGLLLAKSLASEPGGTKLEFSDARRALATLFDSLAEDSTLQGQTEWKELAREAWNFLTSIGLPWPWLAVELLDSFCSLADESFPKDTATACVDQPAPMVELIFRTEPGERRGDAYHRLKGKVWLYRSSVAGESIRSISISDFPDSDRRKDVRGGVVRAKQILGI